MALARSLALLAPLLAGCGTGAIFTRTTSPLTTDFHATPSDVGTGREGKHDIKHVRYQISVLWDSNAIADAARAAGLKTIHYADIETFSVLGIWNQYYVHAYGE